MSGLDAVAIIVQFICYSFEHVTDYYSTEDSRFVLDDRNILLFILKLYCFSSLLILSLAVVVTESQIII